MDLLAQMFAAGLLLWFGLLVLLIVMRILRGELEAEGLLIHSPGPRAPIAPERAVVMTVFPFALAAYVYLALSNDIPVIDGRLSLPDVPESLLALLTGGNSLYLAGKIARGARGGAQ